MNKQMFFGFVIFALATMMMTSQMPEAFADDRNCINETIDNSGGSIKSNIIVPDLVKDGGPFNLCVLDDVEIKGNIIVEANAAVFMHDGTTIFGNVELKGQFSAVNFEGIDTNFLDGNILGEQDTYIFLDSVTVTMNVISKGEVYVSPDNVEVLGNIDLTNSNTNEFVLPAITVGGNVFLDKQLSILVDGATIGGNLIIKESVNDTTNNSFIDILDSSIGGNLQIDSNSMLSTILINGNTVGGNLQLRDNSSLSVNGNTVEGNVSCQKNDSISGSLNVINGKTGKKCGNLS